jgi:M6 family metalloprotease-like protein
MEENLMNMGMLDQKPRSRELTYMLRIFGAVRARADLRMHSNEFTLDEAMTYAIKTVPKSQCFRFLMRIPDWYQQVAGLLILLILIGPFNMRLNAQKSSLLNKNVLIVPPIDPQIVQDQDDMTRMDYHPVPGKNWADPSLKPGRQIRIALVAIDFPDQPFVITLPKHSDPFGNPQIDPIPRDKVAQFYADFYNTPGEVNHGQTINGYWMEQSRGQVGVAKIEAFGPYRMSKNLWEYGCNEFGQANSTPTGIPARSWMEKDCDSIWQNEAGDIIRNYDAVLRIYAGYDETGIWQEFGEMKFRSKEDIPPEWGNPDPTKPRWIKTRYVDWTSWKAGAQQWGLSSMRQGENSGTITHEIGHYLFRTGDNNNNPYVQPYRRVGSGTWDMMDRGSFNGPEGPHSRWKVPAMAGASMPAGLMLRQKMNFKFVTEDQVLVLNRNGLAQSGLAVATITARAADPAPGTVAGIVVRLDGKSPQDRTPESNPAEDPLSPGKPTYNFYSVEVVQRIGYDSFTPDNGVLIAKNKDREGNNGGPNGFNCFNWVIDAHPEDIGKVDYLRPGDGTPVMRTPADYRQLNDALFHAGTHSGSQAEWVDPYNRLHFYILDKQTGANGIISYTVGVRSPDGSGPQTRGVTLDGPESSEKRDGYQRCAFSLTNTGKATSTDSTLHPRNAGMYLNWDIYRLTVSIVGEGWTAQLTNELAALPFGKTQTIPVFAAHEESCAHEAIVTLTATSESDPTQTVTIKYTLKLGPNPT